MSNDTNIPWECSGRPPKYKEHDVVENYGDRCIICGRPRNDSTSAKSTNGRKKTTLVPYAIAAILVAAILGVGGWLVWPQFRQSSDNSILEPQPPEPQPPEPSPSPSPSVSERLSSGERRLLSDKPNPNVARGTEAFANENYSEARDLFAKAVNDAPQDPEAQIYLNNAEARLAGSQVALAVAVPVQGATDSAKEMLRGIADAQTELNQSGGIDGRLLEIVIANDETKPDIAADVAEDLAKNSAILGVIGHNTSDASRAALPQYEQADLAIVSPTSTSTDLSSDVFFRTVPSDEIAGERLAQYATAEGFERVAVFYNPQSNYSNSLQQAFADKFSGQIVQSIDISDRSFDSEEAVQNLQGQVDAVVLFPNKDLVPVALGIASAKEQLPGGQQIQLLGGDALYDPTTLTSGGNAVENLVLAVPWFAQTSYSYAKRAENRWKGQVSWRTATSYDAAKALIDALSSNPNRQSVLDNLKSVSLAANETSGEAFQFSPTGERVSEPILVQAIRGGGGPQGSQFAFQPMQ